MLAKYTFRAPQNFWGTDFYGVLLLTNNTAKMYVGEDLVKIRPAVRVVASKEKSTERTRLVQSVRLIHQLRLVH